MTLPIKIYDKDYGRDMYYMPREVMEYYLKNPEDYQEKLKNLKNEKIEFIEGYGIKYCFKEQSSFSRRGRITIGRKKS